MGSYQRVLVGTDGSSSSFRAVRKAASIASDAGATLLLATIYRPMDARERQAAADALGAESYKVMGAHPAEDVLRDATDQAHEVDRELKVDTVAVEGEPVDCLVQLAKDRKVDLVVVGNRGMTGIKGRILGSVPNGVAHKAECDVLIVDTT